MKDFRDKTIVITGAASGMGLAYAEEFAYLGARIAICDIDGAMIQVVAEELSKLIGPDNVYAECLDVSDWTQVSSFAESVKSKLGPAHVVINNAGVGGSAAPFYKLAPERFARTMRVNFEGVVYGTRAFLPQLVANGYGALVNVSSIFGFIGVPNGSDYVASKFAVRGFTESLMAEFHGSPIQIHCLHPGGIDTAIAREQKDRRFAEEMLVTPPNEIARHVIACLRRGELRIVYGHQSQRVWWSSRILPIRAFIKLFWRDARRVTDTSSYREFNPHLSVED